MVNIVFIQKITSYFVFWSRGAWTGIFLYQTIDCESAYREPVLPVVSLKLKENKSQGTQNIFLSTLSVHRVISCVYLSIFSVLFLSTENAFQIIESLFFSSVQFCMSNVASYEVSGHLGTEHMRHLGTRYWTSRYWKFRYWIIKIIWLNLKTFLNFFLHVDVVFTNVCGF